MKRIMILFIALALISPLLYAPSYAMGQEQGITVLLDGLPLEFDVQPVISNGSTLVPFRAIAEALNVQVQWDSATSTVNASDGTTAVKLQIGNATAYRNQNPVGLDTAPVIVGGRTLIPLRFFSEAFQCRVGWDDSTRTVKIFSAPSPMAVSGYYALGDSQTSSWTDLFGQPYPSTGQGNTDLVDTVSLGWYSLDRDGNLLTRSETGWQRPDAWEDVLNAVNTYHLHTEMVVHLTNSNGDITGLLGNDAAMSNAVNAIAGEARQYDGVNLDFEGLGLSETGAALTAVRDQFTRFNQLLSQQLKAENKTLVLSLHAPNSAYRGYDYQALGQVADRIVIMAYDYGSKPEPVDKVTEAVQTALAQVPAGKLVLGISVPSENTDSIITKAAIAKKYKLDGIALWRLGLMSAPMWDSLRLTVAP